MVKFVSELVFVFFADMLLDIFAVRYTLAANAKPAKCESASFWSVMIALDAGLSTIVFVDNYWTILSGAAGAAIGTYWTLKHASKKASDSD
jgi:hypothetical protein